ncbi:hypothetical protein [Streptomyces laurentii]|uniref:hypothetical protein n=1 Tax=Streptomyces laurentii TaxID=39478 RepID=UPI0036960C1E
MLSTMTTGRHQMTIEIDEDASTAAGRARYRAACACGQMPSHIPGDRAEAVAAYTAHTATASGNTAGPLPTAWIAALVALALLVWATAYAVGHLVAGEADLTAAGRRVVLGTAHLVGLGAGCGLMALVHRRLGPART